MNSLEPKEDGRRSKNKNEDRCHGSVWHMLLKSNLFTPLT